MARTARERDYFGIYHVSQQAREGERLFCDDGERRLFVETLRGQLERYPSEVLAYCLIEPERYHLVIRLFGVDISQFMAGLNIAYARAVERPGGLFRERFRSELLESPAELSGLLAKLKARAGEATRWNSFCTADRFGGPADELAAAANPAGADGESGSCFTDASELRRWIEAALEAEKRSFASMLADKALRNEWICRSRRHSSLTQRELGKLFGGLSESMVSKIIKEGAAHA